VESAPELAALGYSKPLEESCLLIKCSLCGYNDLCMLCCYTIVSSVSY
jgi:hypothetical protein